MVTQPTLNAQRTKKALLEFLKSHGSDVQMDPDLKQRWVESLKSEKYQQATGRLRSQTSEHEGFCCLGVLCDIIDSKKWSLDVQSDGSIDYDYNDVMLPPYVIENHGVTILNLEARRELSDIMGHDESMADLQHLLSWLNDNSLTLMEIGELIENHIGVWEPAPTGDMKYGTEGREYEP